MTDFLMIPIAILLFHSMHNKAKELAEEPKREKISLPLAAYVIFGFCFIIYTTAAVSFKLLSILNTPDDIAAYVCFAITTIVLVIVINKLNVKGEKKDRFRDSEF